MNVCPTVARARQTLTPRQTLRLASLVRADSLLIPPSRTLRCAADDDCSARVDCDRHGAPTFHSRHTGWSGIATGCNSGLTACEHDGELRQQEVQCNTFQAAASEHWSLRPRCCS